MKKLLLIEDEPQLRVNTADILELSGYEIMTAENGKEGVEKALENKPDLVICDIMMPVLDGYGVLKIFNQNPQLTGIPFIFLTAKVERNDFRRGMELGADDYLTKPFGEVELISAIEMRLKKVENIKQHSTAINTSIHIFDNPQSPDLLKSLTANRKPHLFKRKKSIYTDGDEPSKLYFIKKGKIKTFRENRFGKELVTDLYNTGDFFGYISLIANEPYNETAVALEDSELLFIPKENFFDLLYKNASVAKKFIQLLSNKISDKEEQLVGLAYNSLRKRVAQGLLQYIKTFAIDTKLPITITISREELATISGTATESLIRTLTDFRNENLIEIIDGKIVIKEIHQLEQLKH